MNGATHCFIRRMKPLLVPSRAVSVKQLLNNESANAHRLYRFTQTCDYQVHSGLRTPLPTRLTKIELNGASDVYNKRTV